MFHFFKKHESTKPPYLEKIDQLPKLDIIRLKGRMDQNMIPVAEDRIRENRQHGGRIEKNILLDFSKVEYVDSAMIAFHIVHLREYRQKGFDIGFINITEQLHGLLDIFKDEAIFDVYVSEAEAVSILNQ